ncbi:hypothetical protein [Acinetobacter indicus]|uniref:hypothetical protein n=1 Tax=Acinetobacter indicus TaxID=756892 RepID=UPI00209B2061|nr:hypothetical protein [Acinetobacter indicus]MCO8100117.1 hypothetical protein [Acinetobacter indicus]MCO8105638.1 hypothetical protein [Acinetobacter indicus]MCO8111312.1 hypothetical protein [Acinetobacter indicus]
MVQPINYMLDVQNPVQASMAGLTQGMQIGQFMQNKKIAEQKALQEQQMQQELAAFAAKPNKTHEDYANIMARFPAIAENYQRSYSVLDSGRQQATFKTASRVYAALKTGNSGVAKSILETEALGFENAGDLNSANQMKQLAKMAEENPDGLLTASGLMMSSANPDQFKDVLGALNQNDLTPEEINLKRAQTEKTETETLWYGDKTQAEINNLESQVEDRQTGRVLEQQKMQLQNDQFYAKLDQDQQQFYENLNQEERKIAQTVFNVKEKPEQRMERLEKVEGFATAARNAAMAAKNAAQLATDIEALNESVGGDWIDIGLRRLPGTDEYNYAQKVETLKSQIFLAQVDQMRGLGALTESEGAALKSSIESLDLNQDPIIFQNNLRNIAKHLSKAAQSANKKAQIYATKGKGYSAEVVEAAKARGVSPAEMQQIANQLGIE